jgi:lipid-A-disaccharide synthase
MRRDLAGVLSIFPFEQAWFGERGLAVDFIGHPLAWSAAPRGDAGRILRALWF